MSSYCQSGLLFLSYKSEQTAQLAVDATTSTVSYEIGDAFLSFLFVSIVCDSSLLQPRSQ